MSVGKSSVLRAAARWLLCAPLLAAAVWLALELQRPDLLIVGNVTVDLVEGTTPTGGAVSYAAVAARALGAISCVVTVAGPEADLEVFQGSDLFVLPANETLTFEHSYAWFGHSRHLRVVTNPNITITKAHVPWRCRLARVVLLGPLTLHDVDAASFVRHEGFWDWLLNRGQQVGLMAQGFQRNLGPQGEVLPLPEPSTQLLEGLGPRVTLFLSDVETDKWTTQALAGVVAAVRHVIITQGERGAELLTRGSTNTTTTISSSSSSSSGSVSSSNSASSSSTSSNGSSGGAFTRTLIPAVKVARAVDTNGAGDTFAAMFMLAAMRGDPNPGATAAWAASRAVLQPQTCKPRCAPLLITAAPGGLTPIGGTERLRLAAAPLLRHAGRVVAGGLAHALPPGAVQWLQGWVGSVAAAGGGGSGAGCQHGRSGAAGSGSGAAAGADAGDAGR